MWPQLKFLLLIPNFIGKKGNKIVIIMKKDFHEKNSNIFQLFFYSLIECANFSVKIQQLVKVMNFLVFSTFS